MQSTDSVTEMENHPAQVQWVRGGRSTAEVVDCLSGQEYLRRWLRTPPQTGAI